MPLNQSDRPSLRARSHAQMTAVGCGTVEINPSQHSIKQREKCGLALQFFGLADGWQIKVGVIDGKELVMRAVVPLRT
jgi:hypothetical protein